MTAYPQAIQEGIWMTWVNFLGRFYAQTIYK